MKFVGRVYLCFESSFICSEMFVNWILLPTYYCPHGCQDSSWIFLGCNTM